MPPQRNLSLLTGALFLSYPFVIMLASQEVLASSCPRQAPFVFREGDTLSEVLWFLGTEPVYGKRGWIEKTFNLNPALEKFRGKKIPPGTKVLIPIKLCPLKGGWTIENGELIAPYHHSTREKSVTQPDNDLPKTDMREPISEPISLPAVKSTATPVAIPTVKPTATPTPMPTVAPTVRATATPTPMPGVSVPPIIPPSPTAPPARQPRIPVETRLPQSPAVSKTPAASPPSQLPPQVTRTPTPSPSPSPSLLLTPSMIVKTPSPQPTPKSPTTPKAKLEPLQKLRLDIKNSKETFEKAKDSDGQFLNNLKKDEDFMIE